MRTIKFKAKRLFDSKWTCGYFYEENDNTYIIEDYQKESMLNRNITYKVDPDTVCQFTGFLDKNGKEIYEGDVLVGGRGFPSGIITKSPCISCEIISWKEDMGRYVLYHCYVATDGSEFVNTDMKTIITQDSFKYLEVVGSELDKEWPKKLNLKDKL